METAPNIGRNGHRCGDCCLSWSRRRSPPFCFICRCAGSISTASDNGWAGSISRWIAFILIMLCIQMLLLALRWREIVVICGAKLSSGNGVALQLHRPVFQSSLAIDGRWRRRPHLAAGARRGRMADRNLFSADRPRGRRIGLGDHGRRLPAVDVQSDPRSDRPRGLGVDRIRRSGRRIGFPGARVSAFAGDGTMVAHPPSRHRFAAGLATVPIRRRRARRGIVVCDSFDDGDGGLGRGHGRARHDRLRATSCFWFCR